MTHAAPKTYNIVLLPGDGVGPEVTRAARDVLSVIGDFYGHTFSFTEHLIGGAAIDETGDPLPEATRAACVAADAVLLGAVGGPKWDGGKARPQQGLLAGRSGRAASAGPRKACWACERPWACSPTCARCRSRRCWPIARR